MKLKLTIAMLFVLGSTGCVTSSNNYSRDIVYRDGSYYSPADDQNGDYYYEPEPEYSTYYDNQSFAVGYYSNSWYGLNELNRCRYSYYYQDSYCNNAWGSAFLSFGGLTLIFGNAPFYGYGYGDGYGYGYGYHQPYYGHYPYYGHHYGRNHEDDDDRDGDENDHHYRGPIQQTPDYGANHGPIGRVPGGRIPGNPIHLPRVPDVIDDNPADPAIGQVDNGDPRVRPPGRIRPPENWRDNADDSVNNDNDTSADDGQYRRGNHGDNERRLRPLPAPIVDDAAYQAQKKPHQGIYLPRPDIRDVATGQPVQPERIADVNDPSQVPDAQRQERAERPERRERDRSERSERSERAERRDNTNENSSDDADRETRRHRGDNGNI